MLVTTQFKRAWLRRQFAKAQGADPVTPLIELLNEQLADRVDAVETGHNILSTSGDGQSVTFSGASSAVTGAPGAGAMPDLVEDMISRYESAKADLVAGGNATPSDQQIFDLMLASLVAVRSRLPDVTALLVR